MTLLKATIRALYRPQASGMAVALTLGLLLMPLPAQSNALSPDLAQELIAVWEALEADQFVEALAVLNRLVERRDAGMSPFERASVLQVRGSAHLGLDDFPAALRDFERAIAQEALPEPDQRRLQFQVAQLHFVTERYALALELFMEWIKGEENPGSQTWFMIAGAHYQLEQYEDSLQAISTAIPLLVEPVRRYYDLKNALLSELQRSMPRIDLLTQMVRIWPQTVEYWQQLSDLYEEAGDQQRARSALLESEYWASIVNDDSDKPSAAPPPPLVRPLVRHPPTYPIECVRGAQPHETVLVEYHISPEGTVKEAEVIGTTNSCFNQAALRAVERWNFPPRIKGFRTQTAIDFQTGL